MGELSMTNIAIIGCGYWGPNYVRIFNELEGGEVKYCCDLEENNLLKVKKLYHNLALIKDYKVIAKDDSVDAVIITTPLKTHYEIAKLFLERDKHVLVEKPFTSDSKQAEELGKIAQKNHLVLMVGHVYEYNPAVQKLREMIHKKELGSLYYCSAERVGLGPIRKQANALWDLATHDISIALYLLGEYPQKVTAVGEYYLQENIKDLVFINLTFPSRVIYNIYASWIAPEKIRKTTVVGSKGMAVFNDVDKSESLKIYERKFDKNLLDSTPEYSDHQLIVSIGDIHIPKIEQTEPLKSQARHFLQCILDKKKPLSDAEDGLRVVKVLEAAERSLKSKRTVRCQ
jgi:predicted dehydrogenase